MDLFLLDLACLLSDWYCGVLIMSVVLLSAVISLWFPISGLTHVLSLV